MKQSILIALINWYQSAEQSLPRWLERACESDPVLAREKAAGERLTRSLKAPRRRTPAESGAVSLSAQVMRRISEEDYRSHVAPEPRESAWLGLFGKGAALAATLAVALLAVQLWRDQPQKLEEGGPQSAPLAGVQDASPELPATLPRLDPDALRLGDDWENPLNKEMRHVLSDAKGALDYLAQSFVPKRYLEGARPDRGGDDQV